MIFHKMHLCKENSFHNRKHNRKYSPKKQIPISSRLINSLGNYLFQFLLIDDMSYSHYYIELAEALINCNPMQLL